MTSLVETLVPRLRKMQELMPEQKLQPEQLCYVWVQQLLVTDDEPDRQLLVHGPFHVVLGLYGIFYLELCNLDIGVFGGGKVGFDQHQEQCEADKDGQAENKA